MKNIEALLASPFFQRLGWSLLAFLWQGTLVAAVLACTDAILRRRKAAHRYAAGCGALLLMLALPVVTALRHPAGAEHGWRAAGTPVAAPAAMRFSGRLAPATGTPASGETLARRLARTAAGSAVSLTPWLAAGWMCGVLLLSFRFIAGWTVVRRLPRRAFAVPPALLPTLTRLSARLRVCRPVLLLQSAAVGVPTALGALRPVILLPVSAVTGLAPEAIEALLAHELAHIRRHDYLVNLLQTAAETLLFYHPAVWWVSHRIRVERENCCDDLAVTATGDSRSYARALVGLEEIRRPIRRPVLAANGGTLWRRVARLLPAAPPQGGGASAWVAGVLALVALGTLGAAARIFPLAGEEWTASKTVQRSEGIGRFAAGTEDIAGRSSAVAGGVAGGIEGGIGQGTAGSVRRGVSEAGAGGITGGVAGGVEAGAAGGVAEDPTPGAENGRAGKSRLSSEDLDALRTHGVTPEFLHSVAALGYTRASIDDLLALRIHGVSPEFVERFHEAGYSRVSSDEAMSLRIHGVDADSAPEWTRLAGRQPGLDEIVSARIHGVTPDFAREMKSFGFEASLDTLVTFRIHGVTADFVRSLGSLGFPRLSADEALSCRIHGVTPDFIKEIQSQGYAGVSLDELTSLRIHGATPEFIRGANRSAGARLSIDELLDRRIHGRNE